MCIFVPVAAAASMAATGAGVGMVTAGASIGAAATMGAGVATGISMTAVSTVAGVAGTVMSTMNSMQQAKSQKKWNQYNAAVARNNAKIAEYEGEYVQDKAQRDAEQVRTRTRAIIGQQRAAQGASGMAVEDGTFMDLTLESAESGRLDELAVLHEGDREAWRAQINADNAQAKARMHESAKVNPMMAAGPGLMSGLANTGMNYYRMMQ